MHVFAGQGTADADEDPTGRGARLLWPRFTTRPADPGSVPAAGRS